VNIFFLLVASPRVFPAATAPLCDVKFFWRL
jgi:hypothetical protein